VKKEPLDSYLNSFINYERYKNFPRKVDLKDYLEFLKIIGNPHSDLSPSMLIAGTNGKGSTAAIIGSILYAGGYRVGTFTSPHILSFRERLKVNERIISRSEYRRIIEQLKPELDKPYQKKHRTFFEILTTLAFLYFKSKSTDINIFEVGLGGRKDSTNVVTPLISVITSIGYDHMNSLGETLPEITMEKCGIIGEGGTVVCSTQSAKVMKTVEEIVREKGARLYVDEMIDIEPYTLNNEGIHFTYKNREYFLPMLGRFQLKNLKTALLTVEVLSKKGFGVSEDRLSAGLKMCRWRLRFDIVNREPLIILDGAHNTSAMQELMASLKELFPWKKIILIFSCLSSKDIKGMASILQRYTDIVILTSINSERAAAMGDLKSSFKKKVMVTEKIEDAIELGKELWDKSSLILITGSIYLVSEAYEILCT
jgi:dihydrofolate synthase/folylpolyglutamate synthase